MFFSKRSVWLGVYLSGIVSSLSASPVTFTDVWNPSDFAMHQDRPTYSFVHDIIDNGFNPETDTITSAKIIFDLRDDSTSDPVELANFNVDGHDYGTFDVDFTNFTFGLDLSLLQTDGRMDQMVQRIQGDYQFRQSTLVVTGERVLGIRPDASAVPEPATLLLMGSATGALGLLRKRKKALEERGKQESISVGE